MNSESGIGQFPPFWPILFCSQVALSCEAGFHRSPREKGKNKRGGGKKGTPPGASNSTK